MHWLQELEIRVYYIVEKFREVIRYVSAQTAFNNKRKRKRNEWKNSEKKNQTDCEHMGKFTVLLPKTQRDKYLLYEGVRQTWYRKWIYERSIMSSDLVLLVFLRNN